MWVFESAVSQKVSCVSLALCWPHLTADTLETFFLFTPGLYKESELYITEKWMRSAAYFTCEKWQTDLQNAITCFGIAAEFRTD
jgi:hypothetical protein